VQHSGSRPGLASRPTRWASAFGRFWWDFLVGDTPELFVGMLIVLAVAAGLGGAGVAGWVVVPLVVIAVLAVSVALGARRSGGA
jgi:hypothetical protein